MTLEYFKDYQELFDECVCWWQGRDQTRLGFPIIPGGTTGTPNGTWSDTLDLGNNVSLKTFAAAASRYISFTGCSEWALGTGDFTITLWVRVGTIGADVFPALWFGEINSTGYYSHLYYDTRTSQGDNRGMRYYALSSVGNVAVSTFDGVNYATNWQNAWHYVTITRSSGTFTIHKNGVAINSAVNNTVVVGQSDKTMWIGRQILSGATPFTGNIKDLMIFKGRALTQPEIITLMRLTEPGKRDITPILPGIRGVE